MKKVLSSQMPVSCTQWREKLAALHPNDLSPEERAALDQHVAICSNCSAVRAEYEEMNALISHFPAAMLLATLPSQVQHILEDQHNAEQQGHTAWNDIPSSLPLQYHSLSAHGTSRMMRLKRATSTIAAVLVVGAILGSSLLLFQRQHTNTGSANWNCPASISRILPPSEVTNVQAKPALSQSLLYVISSEKSIEAIHLNNGAKVRTYQIAHASLFNMTVANGIIYADVLADADSTSFIYALRASDGVILWHHPVPQLDISESPIIENGRVYVDSQDQYVYVLHETNGSLIGQYKKIGVDDSLLAVNNGLIYVQHGYGLYVLQTPNGRVLWQFAANDLNHSPDVTIADGRVYIQAGDNSIYILQASDGHLIRKITPPLSSGFQPMDAPLVVGSTIYDNAIGGYIYGLQADDGSPLWCSRVNGSSTFLKSFTVANGMLYASISAGQIDALDASSGKLLWQFQTENSGFVLSPIVHDGTVYGVTLNNTVYALRGSDGKLLWRIVA